MGDFFQLNGSSRSIGKRNAIYNSLEVKSFLILNFPNSANFIYNYYQQAWQLEKMPTHYPLSPVGLLRGQKSSCIWKEVSEKPTELAKPIGKESSFSNCRTASVSWRPRIHCNHAIGRTIYCITFTLLFSSQVQIKVSMTAGSEALILTFLVKKNQLLHWKIRPLLICSSSFFSNIQRESAFF